MFQFFNVFNARVEKGSAFNARFFENRMLWLSLSGVLALQVLVVYWPPGQSLFNVTSLSLRDWGLAVGVASSVLLFEETRKLFLRILRNIEL